MSQGAAHIRLYPNKLVDKSKLDWSKSRKVGSRERKLNELKDELLVFDVQIVDKRVVIWQNQGRRTKQMFKTHYLMLEIL